MFLDNIGSNIKIQYRTTEDDVINDFYVPVLGESVKYDRSVGYFSSSILIAYIQGLEKFIQNKGHMSLLISPFVSLEDGQALIDSLNPIEETTAQLNELFKTYRIIGEKSNISAQILVQLIREGYLDVRVVVPNRQQGLFHEKVALFYDEIGNVIATSGSNNETKSAIQFNLEYFSVFRSWINGQQDFIDNIKSNFSSTWNSKLKYFHTVTIQESVSNEILKSYETNESISDLYHRLSQTNPEKLVESELSITEQPLKFEPYDYQRKAAAKWLERKKGIISFATGTGKTKTAIYATQKLVHQEGPQFFVIVVPDKTLVQQWASELSEYSEKVIKCYSENNDWAVQLKNSIKYWEFEPSESIFVVSTIPTYFSDKMIRQIRKLRHNYVLIADECHRLGTESILSKLPDVERRLGLSATPSIYMSEDKTERLFKYFGGIIAEYSLEKAIENHKLTKYEYHPIEVQLSDAEIDKYKKLTLELVKMLQNPDDELNFESLSIEAQMKIFQRARIVYGAQEKIEKLSDLLDNLHDVEHMLIYCGATTISESAKNSDIDLQNEEVGIRQIESVNRMLSMKGIPSAQYTKDENGRERRDRIDSFKNGTIRTLVAIKALDEGVDIPQISTGIILASSGNPREFVQRRGRLLRRSAGKEIAIIYDMVVLGSGEEYESINRSELKRVKEFTSAACNRSALEVKYNYLFDKYLEEEHDGKL
ncbi:MULTISPECIES: DEAD/DEAH box helicase family protein [Leuconostoc]|uniref:DEAD/DEAH box helicase family protein n=1 Tax=Leuconostoc TaxID=1243 RepID=UPI0004616D11|nr:MULTISPECIES: DEAD/DEAH box helicase family protein [Leuconostoc]KDA49017.1 putative DNA-repair helicase [Leuconostoc pseudomesenteroides PS12]OQJ70602.1 DNA repair helicase [Leuconostoc pseudomesenteroides]KDA49141.1 hypothetical protein L965_1632 [Leuconostoc pseudomesenteroides PS12]MDG9745408.1 DEAD/DEAH box helicase family protein [Leuconostoc falkenbergense]ORI50391.1 DNA repair helicase [Leuconostoc pseudomesenteroides]